MNKDSGFVELEDLVGEHVLSGVDMVNRLILVEEGFEDCQVVNFVLDGDTYTAVEDPQDGYRSCLRSIFKSSDAVGNRFVGHEVVARMREGEEDDCEILDFVDVRTGKIVLSVGTDYTDDYYPWWVAEYNPENLDVNAKGE